MPGFSITLLLLPSISEGDANTPRQADILTLLDERVEVPGWKWSSPTPPVLDNVSVSASQTLELSTNSHVKVAASDPGSFIQHIQKACRALIAAEPEITQMDNIAGDGDCGLTLQAGANGG